MHFTRSDFIIAFKVYLILVLCNFFKICNFYKTVKDFKDFDCVDLYENFIGSLHEGINHALPHLRTYNRWLLLPSALKLIHGIINNFLVLFLLLYV